MIMQKPIGIVTDSGASIPPELVDKYDLAIVPMGIQIDGKFYRDGIDLTPEEFYALMDEHDEMTTSQPTPEDFMTVYQGALQRAKELISVHITSKASGTVQVAELVRQSIGQQSITVIDSATASMGQGFLVLEAAKMAMQGRTKEEIIQRLETLKDKIAVYVAVPTLKYLSRSGKVGKVQALLANMLKIKPILRIQKGVAEVTEKTRSYPKALSKLIDLVESRYPDQPLRIAILHTNAPKLAADFRTQVEQRLHCVEVMVTEMGSALAVHGGKGMLGLAACPDEN